MAQPFHNEAYAEEYQTNAYNGFPFMPEFGHRRHAPREEPFIRHNAHGRSGPGWYQGNHKIPKFKSKKYFVRPVDGARRGTMGRMKDAFTGQGADVFVVANGDRRTLHREMPGRERWTNWASTGMQWPREAAGGWTKGAFEDMDWYPPGNLKSMPWAKREDGNVYNFRTRQYEDFDLGHRKDFWADAHWPRGERGKRSIPSCWRTWDGKWLSTVSPSAGKHVGGRPLVNGGFDPRFDGFDDEDYWW
ncbi:unnamed protein product [Zymoseptoria tritici ST99CH_1A5]|uniref:Uncharacterized protein n=3 Tax=Zymoseptoria TaxID=1047167 RepID=A0A0F4GT46_9PEZI|nr:hypothetical protein TI39_contig323g00036 [Zymoseptoria brevis]SMR48908.1 unnamed protein product [Zymoseptoria tritici ST99CH_1E4]SMR50093.1 unnamed protein product [Zymoseptoria tritici ST99CH_3D1]SMY22793.1 unnamed protein product [Zymoseptoria tritici ST99CH_1A5]